MPSFMSSTIGRVRAEATQPGRSGAYTAKLFGAFSITIVHFTVDDHAPQQQGVDDWFVPAYRVGDAIGLWDKSSVT